MSEAMQDSDLSYQQSMIYAEELGELYRRNRKSAAELQAAREARQRIEDALANRVLKMVFQPVVDLETGDTAGMEALARFDVQPSRPPNLWFGEASSVGLAEELELQAAVAALDHLDRIPASAYLSINLSPATMLSPLFREACGSYSMERAVLEVTEHARVADYKLLQEALRWFRRAGGRLAVDDAGAGFASLRHILLLEPDFIKIDISLTRDIHKDPTRRALARALISFAHDISATIIAEGIETDAEVEALRDLGVRYGQGYHLGRPAPITWSPIAG